MRKHTLGSMSLTLGILLATALGGVVVSSATSALGAEPGEVPAAPTVELSFTPGTLTATLLVDDGASVQAYLYAGSADGLGSGGEPLSSCITEAPSGTTSVSCVFPGLTAGNWALQVMQGNSTGVSASDTVTFTVPDAPTITGASQMTEPDPVSGSAATGALTLTGTAPAGDTVRVIEVSTESVTEGDTASDTASGTVLCSATVEESGIWTCAATIAAGTHLLQAYALNAAGTPSLYSDTYETSTIEVVVVEPTPTPTPTPNTEPTAPEPTTPESSTAPLSTPTTTPTTPTTTTETTETPSLASTAAESVTAESVTAATPTTAVDTTAASTPSPTPTATSTPTPLVWTLEIGGIDGTVRAGQTVTLGSVGLPPGSTVEAELHSTPVSLGATTVGADGSFLLIVVVPATVEPGDHHFVVTVTAPGGVTSTSETAVTIAAADAITPDDTTSITAESAPTEDIDGAPARITTDADRSDASSPSSLSGSLGTVGAVFSSPVAIGSSVLAGLAFLVLVAFPAELLSAAVKDKYAFLDGRMPRAPRHWATLRAWFGVRVWFRVRAWFGVRPSLSGILLVTFASLVLCFADPNFGFDIVSVRLFIACLAGALISSYGSYLLTARILLHRWELPSTLRLRPMTLVLTVAGVIASRLLDFTPGFLFGLMLGLSFPATATVALRAAARVVRTGLILTTALLAWVAYSVAVASGTPTGFGSALFQDSLAALSTEGLTGIVIAMLPLLFLEGEDIWAHSKRLWAGTYATVTTVFFLVVAPKPDSWADLGDRYGSWGWVLAGFGAVAMAAYLALRVSERRDIHRQENDTHSPENDTHSPEKAAEPTSTSVS